MITVVKPQGATVANKALQLVAQTGEGLLVDVDAAWFQIFDTTTSSKEETPVQVWPVTVGTRQAVNLVSDKIGTGRYAAIWASASAGLGRYFVRWSYRFTSTGPEYTFDQEFEVAPAPYLGRNYCALYDLQADGIPLASAGGGAAQKLIAQSSRYIEFYTGRQFSPAYKTITASGRSGRGLLLDEAIVAIEGLNIDYRGEFIVANREVGSFRVFNRHITENLFLPDDRDSPKLEFLHGADWSSAYGDDNYDRRFRSGVRNVQVTGIFGYTEPDGSMVGQTPELIRLACRLLCAYSQYPAGSKQRRDALSRARITSEYTRDQGYIMDKPDSARASPFISHTMDPEIDAILYGFIRPPALGAA